MLSYEERIQLRDELIQQFIDLNLLFKWKDIFILRKKDKLQKILLDNKELQIKYNQYISNFRSELEALWCLTHIDDYINHICPICKRLCTFYSNQFKYRKTCGNKQCQASFSYTDEANKKKEQTNMRKYGTKHSSQSSKVKQKLKQTVQKKYGTTNVMKLKKFQIKQQKTMEERHGVKFTAQSAVLRAKMQATSIKNNEVPFAQQSTTIKAKTIANNIKNLGVANPMQNTEIKNKNIQSRIMNNIENNPITDIELQEVLLEINNIYQKEITLGEIYITLEYFSSFIKLLSIKKNRLLRLNEIASFFTFKKGQTIKRKIIEYNLLEYFYIQHSELEEQFKMFLSSNNINFEHRNHSILPLSENNGHKELDFYLHEYNIAFEINDTASHNIKDKDLTYHYNKTIQCLQKDIRLIHLWEWELNETNWSKTSQWILHLLNQSKTEIKSLNAEDLRLVSKSEELDFLNKYSITSYQSDSDICFGIYQNNELIQTLSFKDNILSICLKFNYSISKETFQIIQYYKQFKNLDNILVYNDISKFIGKSLEDIGFKLIDHIEANIINENINEDSEYYQLYNCGYNVYELK